LAATRDFLAAPGSVQPERIRYASIRVVDGSTFVAQFELADGTEDPRPAIPEYGLFLEQLRSSVDGPPVTKRLDVV